MKSEKWKYIEGQNKKYLISSNGKVISRKNGQITLKGELLHDGYIRHAFSNNGEVKRYRRARLVASYFIRKPKPNEQVNHINGIKTDDRVSNLEWCTPSENNNHKIKILKRSAGSDHYKSKLTLDQVNFVRKSSDSLATLGKKFGVHKSTISKIKLRKTWKYEN